MMVLPLISLNQIPRIRSITHSVWEERHSTRSTPLEQACRAQLKGEIQAHEWGRIANMADPFGNGFCLIEFIERGYDEIIANPL
jgi:hypothetical protein